MPSHKNKTPVTHLCRYDRETIVVRDKNLVKELIGEVSFTQMILFHLTKEMPSAAQIAIVDAVLVTLMEHGMTPSAIAARETFLGAPEALQGAVAAGLLGIGNRFAGAAGQTAALLDEILAAPEGKRPDTARAIAERHKASKTPVPGFGHPIHKPTDPRAQKLLQVAREAKVEGKYLDALDLLSATVNEVFGKTLAVNATAAIGAVLSEAGLPPQIMRGICLISRCAGLVGHLLEEMEEPAGYYLYQLAEEKIPYKGTA